MGTEHTRATQILYGQLEDALREWGRRDPSSPHRRYELAADDALRLCGELAETVRVELAQYREHKTWGE